MRKSPGHQKWPDHKVQESRVGHEIKVEINGEVVADSHDVVKVEEDGHPVRYYFPRSDVATDKLTRSKTVTECPFKGTARYFELRAGGKKIPDAVWTYEDPYQEHEGLKDRLAFYDDRNPEISVTPKA